jgi:Flp pilus assembly protein TadD
VRPTAETHNGLGYVLARQGRTDEAMKEFRKAIEASPHFTPAYNNLAEALAGQGKLEEAASYYERSLEQRPSAAVQKALDAVRGQLRSRDAAVDRLTKAAVLGPVR